MVCVLTLAAAAACAAAPMTVNGKVVDLDGAPVSGAVIDLANGLMFDAVNPKERHGHATTGPNGAFSVQLDFEATVARAEAAGYAQVEPLFIDQWLRVTRGQALTFRLRKVLGVSGSVVDEAGKPIEGVMVGEEHSDRESSRFTDAQGNFNDVPMVHGTSTLFIYRRGYVQQLVAVSSSPVKIVMKKKPTVAVYLVDSTGKPLTGHWDVASFRADGSRVASCTTRDAEGDCTLEVELGEMHLKATVREKTVEQVVTVKGTQKFDVRFSF